MVGGDYWVLLSLLLCGGGASRGGNKNDGMIEIES